MASLPTGKRPYNNSHAIQVRTKHQNKHPLKRDNREPYRPKSLEKFGQETYELVPDFRGCDAFTLHLGLSNLA